MLPRTRSKVRGLLQVGIPIMSICRHVLPEAKQPMSSLDNRSRDTHRSFSIASRNMPLHSCISVPVCEYSRAQCSAGVAKVVQSDAIFAIRRSVITERPVRELRSSTEPDESRACTSAQYLMGSLESKAGATVPCFISLSRTGKGAPKGRQWLPGLVSRTRAGVRRSAVDGRSRPTHGAQRQGRPRIDTLAAL